MLRIDLHCDTITMMGARETLAHNKRMVNLAGLQASNTLVQCFAAFVPTGYFPGFCRARLAGRMFERSLRNYRKALAVYPDALHPVLCAADIDICRQQGKIGALLTIEDGGVLGTRIEHIADFYEKGVRLVTFTWNSANPLGHPHSSKPQQMARGLTPFGLEALAEMERLGILADVSHLSDGGFWDVAKHAGKPFVASHSNARAVTGHTRNLTDDMIRMLAEKGGVAGLNFAPQFLGPPKGNRVEDMVRHIQHMHRVGGEDVLALGSDFDGIHGENEVGRPEDCEKLAQALEKAGFGPALLEKIWYKNAERVLKETIG